MATQVEKFIEIANAIRSKTGRNSQIVANNFASEISSIPFGFYNIDSPYDFDFTNFSNAYAAVKAAMSYHMAKTSETMSFKYSDGNGPLKGSTSAQVFSNGEAVCDCSTYIGLVLRGLDYLSSPYTGSSDTIDPRTVVCNSSSWAESYFDLQTKRYTGDIVFPTFDYLTTDGKYRVLTASDIAMYYSVLGRSWFAGDRDQRVGDLCFFYKEDSDGSLYYPSRFLGISHIGIMTDSAHFLNMTDYAASGNMIRTAIASRQPYIYARPYYGAIKDGITDKISTTLDLIPDMWSGVAQGTTVTDGRTIKVSGKSLTLSTTGTQSDYLVLGLISSSCPLTLPSGTYSLSGVVNNTGGNTTIDHSFFGIRVYDSDGNGIPGETTTSDGNTVSARNPVWDIGGGATFTLTAETSIIMNAYFSNNMTFTNLSFNPILKRVA